MTTKTPGRMGWRARFGGAAALAVAAGLMLGGCRSTPREATPEVAMTADQRLKSVESFDKVWTTIRDSHWDPSLGGLDWEGVRAELRPKAEAAATMGEVRGVMGEMIGRLGLSHFGIIPGDAYEAAEAKPEVERASTPESGRGAGEPGSPGLELRLLPRADGRPVAVVKSVEAGGGAASAGVKPGWILDSVGGREVAPVLARLSEAMKDKGSRNLVMTRAVEGWFEGDEGDRVRAEWTDGRGRTVRTKVALGPRRGTKIEMMNLPPEWVRMEARRIDQRIGYLSLNIFLAPNVVSPWWNERVREFRDAPGIVVDLRGNPGGIAAMAMGMSGWFIADSGQTLGTLTTRGGPLRLVVNPRVNGFRGPVAVLVDELSASTSEIMASGLQGRPNVRVFGVRTAGAALPSVFEKLPNGDRFQYAFANLVDDKGRRLEGDGVTPDEVIPLTREALLAGRDPVLERAVAWIMERSGGSGGPAAPTAPTAPVAPAAATVPNPGGNPGASGR
ncbi:MAG: hypothetical protein IBJ11_08480 [Phycisphaerales bacterium]|nr:hypothetical protein [Phycisphaerales bacterium]